MDDGCCPAGCNANIDDDCSVTCGNEVAEPGETCDGDCPTTCDDSNACTIDEMTGSAGNCNVACAHQSISECIMGDDCCPSGCDANLDDDCSPSCGNGVNEEGETCDGDCPEKCNDGNSCTIDAKTGSAENCNVSCTYQEITECAMADGCCPSGCNAVLDDDCSPSCGNAVTEPGETCDGDCPEDCGDGNACTIDEMTGSNENCNVACAHTIKTQCKHKDDCCPSGCDAVSDDDCSPSCGNGVNEPGETCDGDCPEVCTDGNACTIDSKTGSAENCNVACSFQEITECAMGDGCCPAGCNANIDDDCSAKCGNGVIEPGETCDGDCRKSCDDESACTIDTLTGSEENCNVACSYQVINACEYGDGCCPTGCDATTDDDCSPTCGNGVIEPPNEFCDGLCIDSCEDGDACTIDILVGGPETCNSGCTFQLITECADIDGCCPPGCDLWTDADCDPCVGPGCTAPDGWTCPAAHYNTQDGCDCDCGLYDPDCDIVDATLYGCDIGHYCDAEGVCTPFEVCDPHVNEICHEGNVHWTDACGVVEEVKDDCAGHPCYNDQCWPEVPVGWTCAPGYYNATDGCDCGCGPYDPDCDVAGAYLYGCNDGEECDATGACVPMTDCEPHARTKCIDGDLYWLDSCYNQEDLAEDCGDHLCADGQCWPEVPVGWTCQPRYYNKLDGCDCECGAIDPDCDEVGAYVYNCDLNEICDAEGKCKPGCNTPDTCYNLFSVPRDPNHAHVRVTGSFTGWGDSLATGALDMFVNADGSRWERWVTLSHAATIEFKFLVKWAEEDQQWCVLTDGEVWDCAEGAANMTATIDCTTCPEAE